MSCHEIIQAYSHNKGTCKQSTVYFMHLKFNSRRMNQWVKSRQLPYSNKEKFWTIMV